VHYQVQADCLHLFYFIYFWSDLFFLNPLSTELYFLFLFLYEFRTRRFEEPTHQPTSNSNKINITPLSQVWQRKEVIYIHGLVDRETDMLLRRTVRRTTYVLNLVFRVDV
jgi:hypothetical protein